MKKFVKISTLVLITILTIVLFTSCIKYHYNSNVDLGKYLSKLISELYEPNNETKNKIASSSELATNIIYSVTHDELTNLSGKVETLSKYPLPLLNEILYGFRVNGIYDFEERNAKVVLFEHLNTGAMVFLISNDDIDKSACLGFNTLAYDDKGIPHIFEHATLSGSEKYNNPNIHFEMSTKTYTTYVNAFTSQFYTCYPVGSLSDEQLLSCYKMYLDGVMKPNVLNNEIILENEAYRYVLKSKNDDLQLSGVVYSEMSAYEGNIIRKADINANKTLFKDSYLSFETGGLPSEIPKVTQEDLIEFHNKYYQPSNMIITLYGDLDYKKYLEYTNNEYLVNYDKKRINKDDTLYHKNDGFVEKKYDFPVASNSNIENGSIITYSISFEGMSAYETGLFDIVLHELNRDNGTMSKRISEGLPKAMFHIDNYLASPMPYINIVFQNVNENDKSIIKTIVEDSFNELIKNGIDEEILNAYIDSNEMDFELTKDSHGFTNELSHFYEYTFMNNGDTILGYFEALKAMRDLKDRYTDGTINRLIKNYLSSNKNSSLTITVPKRGLLEKNNEELNKYLKNYKQNLSDDELNKLIEKNKEYDKWVSDNQKSSDINLVRVASVSGLPEYKANCYAYEENVEGIRFIRSDIDGINYSYFDIMFDVSGVKFNDLHKLKLLSNLFLYLPTKNYKGLTLSSEFNKYSYIYGASLYVNHYWDGGYKPYLSFFNMSLNKNADKVFELLDELMNFTEFNDTEKLKNFISQEYIDCKMSATSNPTYLSDTLIDSKIFSGFDYDEYMNGLPYLEFLEKAKSYNDNELNQFLVDCKNILSEIYNRDGMVCEIISNFNNLSNIKKQILNLVKDFKEERIEAVDYSNDIKKHANNVAFALNTNVQYNYIGIPFKENDIEFDAKYYVIDGIVNNKILYPEFRVKRSCYGAYISTSRFGSYMYTYRDPELKNSFDVFKDVPKILKILKITEDELEDYKLNAYSKFSYPLTKLSAATVAIEEILQKCNEKRPERYIKYMKQVKDTKLSDLNELKKRFTLIIEKGFKVSVGSKDLIDDNKDLFDEILYDYYE